MKRRSLFSKLLLSITCLCALNASHAGTQPKFTIVPTTATIINITDSDTATVQYVVTNQTKVRRTLTMSPIQGITQLTTDAGACANPFTLGYQESCLLNLQLNGATLPERVTRGPEICKTESDSNNTPDPFLCSQPTLDQSLNITRTATTEAVGSLYITNADGTDVSLCSLASNTSVGSCQSTGGVGAVFITGEGIALNNTKTRVYISYRLNNSVSFCPIESDGTLGVCVDSGATGEALTGAFKITLNADNSEAYIGCSQKVVLCPINNDGTFGTCTETATDASFLGFTSVTFNAGETKAYVSDISTNSIFICDVNGDGTLSGCTNTNYGPDTNSPLSMTLNNTGDKLYIAGGLPSPIILCDVSLVDSSLSNCTDINSVGALNVPMIALNSANTFAYYTADSTNLLLCPINSATGAFDTCQTVTDSTFDGPNAIALIEN